MPPVKKPEWKRSETFLRQWRKFRHMTQVEVSDRLEIDQATLGRVERGLLPYNQDFLEKAAITYGCDPEDLLSIDPTRPDPPKLVYDAIKNAPRAKQDEVWRVVQAMLKTG